MIKNIIILRSLVIKKLKEVWSSRRLWDQGAWLNHEDQGNSRTWRHRIKNKFVACARCGDLEDFWNIMWVQNLVNCHQDEKLLLEETWRLLKISKSKGNWMCTKMQMSRSKLVGEPDYRLVVLIVLSRASLTDVRNRKGAENGLLDPCNSKETIITVTASKCSLLAPTKVLSSQKSQSSQAQ